MKPERVNPDTRLSERKQQIQQAGIPRTGPLYCVPKPEGKSFVWEIVPFYEPDIPHPLDHTKVWKDVLILLAHWWNRSEKALLQQLRSAYTGLPRARVVRNARGYCLLHGEDHADAQFASTIQSLYCLPEDDCVLFDEHELFQSTLEIPTNLEGLDFEFDWED